MASFDPAALDRKADPCVDFYQYACGSWMAANPIPGDHSRWGRFDTLQERNRETVRKILEEAAAKTSGRSANEQKIGDYYAACMDEKAINAKGIAPLRPDLDRIAAMQDKAGLSAIVTRLYTIGAYPFFRFGSTPDAKDSTHVIADLDQGGMGLPDRDFYFNADARSVDIRKAYVAYIQKILELLGDKPEQAASRAQIVMDMETALAKPALNRVARRNPENLYHKMTVKELAQLDSNFKWESFFQGVGAPRIDSLNVDVPDFVKGMDGVVKDFSLDALKSYLAFRLVSDNASVLPAAFEDAYFDFYQKTLRGTKEMPARWKRCSDETDAALPDALGRKFIDLTLGPDGIHRTQEMVAGIEKAMAEDLQSLDWMTPATKEQALDKLHSVLNKIGTKEHWISYAKVKVTRDDAYGNAVRTGRFELDRQLAKIGKPVDRKDWQMSPPTVNAYYDPQENDINFPAGILQPPFFDNKMDDAVNYGGIGAVIGHELTHAFDDEGRQYDGKGNLRDWWTSEDAKAFEQHADCLIKEYGSFSPISGVSLNGKLTLGENTADNGGVRLALMALMNKLDNREPEKRDGFTAQQRLFLGYAQLWCENRTPEAERLRAQTDPHSPGRFRVNGVVSNMPEFQKAFACTQNQPMVRGPACRVW